MSGLPFLIIGLLAIFFADPWRRINAALEEQFGWTRGPAHETGLAFYRSRYAV